MCDTEYPKKEILKTAYELQTRYLQWLSEIDFKIFTGFLTIQLVFAGWLSQYPPTSAVVGTGLLIVDGSMASLACALLLKNQKRRVQEVEKLANIYDALEFSKEGVYLPNKQLSGRPESRPSLWLNIIAIIASLVGVFILIVRF